MVMSITSALQQKHQEEQNSLCNAVKLLIQSPGYIEEFVKKKKRKKKKSPTFSCFPSRQVSNTVGAKILLIALFYAAHSDFYSPHGPHISQGEV